MPIDPNANYVLTINNYQVTLTGGQLDLISAGLAFVIQDAGIIRARKDSNGADYLGNDLQTLANCVDFINKLHTFINAVENNEIQ